MAQPQRLDPEVQDFEHLTAIGKPVPAPTLSATPRLVVAEPDVGLGMEIISRATALIVGQRQHAALVEKRAVEAEERLNAAVQRIAATELKLRSTLEELQRERERSAELLTLTQGMLDEASERLVAAENRSEAAHRALDSLVNALDERLGTELGRDA